MENQYYYCPSCGKAYDSLKKVSECLSADLKEKDKLKAQKEQEEAFKADLEAIQNQYAELLKMVSCYNQKLAEYGKTLTSPKYSPIATLLMFEDSDKDIEEWFKAMYQRSFKGVFEL